MCNTCSVCLYIYAVYISIYLSLSLFYRDSRLKVPISHQGFPLPAGKMVRVEEIVQLPHQLRVRARLAHPAGWITLLNLETGRPLEPREPREGRSGKSMGKSGKTYGKPMGIQPKMLCQRFCREKSWK